MKGLSDPAAVRGNRCWRDQWCVRSAEPGGLRFERRQPERRLDQGQTRQDAGRRRLGRAQARSRLLRPRRCLISDIERPHGGRAGRPRLKGQRRMGDRRERQESREPDRQEALQPSVSMGQRSRRHVRLSPRSAKRVVAKARSDEGWAPPEIPSRRMNRGAHRVLLQGAEVDRLRDKSSFRAQGASTSPPVEENRPIPLWISWASHSICPAQISALDGRSDVSYDYG
jgi:hypothetical protein